jgi:hypothetical protein
VGLVMNGPGRLWAMFDLPYSGEWDVWLQGEVTRPVHLSVDRLALGSIGGELGGNSLNPDTTAPLGGQLSAGRNLLFLTRGGFSLAPGDGGSARLDYIFLTPAGTAAQQTLRVAAPADWRSLCGRAYDWIEVVRG